MDILFTDKREIGTTEMKYDVEYRYIPEEDKGRLIEFAWQKGILTAQRCRAQYADAISPEELAQKLGVRVVTKTTGPDRIFSEYYSNTREIRLLRKSIEERFIPQNLEALTVADFDHVKHIFIAHELFHHLECHDPEVGLTYREYRVTVLSVGPFQRKAGLKCLSEIAAHSFTKAYLGIGHRY